MSEEINGVIGSHDKKGGETVVIVISGTCSKQKAEKLKADVKKATEEAGLTMQVKKSSK